MTDHLPDPLVPPEVDLRDFQFMPLDVVRLRDCGLVSDFEAEEALAAILLWSASWHQVPASSLPDSDKQLSKLAGYGKGVRDYLKIKAGSLHRFIKCSDGRWYHPVVAEKAADGWNAKIEEAHKRACDRQRKANKERKERHEPELPMPIKPPLLSNRPSNGTPCWRYWNSDGTQVTSAGNPDDGIRNSGLKGREGTGTEKGQGSEEKVDLNPQARASTEASTGPPEAARAPDSAAQGTLLGAMSKALRDDGVVGVTPSHPLLVGWQQAGVTIQLLREAVDLARDKKPKPEPIPIKYLEPIVAELLQQPRKPINGSMRNVDWWSTLAGITAKAAELGIATDGQDELRLRCAIAAHSDADTWPWIDPRNATEQRIIAEIRAQRQEAA